MEIHFPFSRLRRAPRAAGVFDLEGELSADRRARFRPFGDYGRPGPPGNQPAQAARYREPENFPKVSIRW